MQFETLTPAKKQELAKMSNLEQATFLFVERHPDYQGHLLISSLNNWFIKDFHDIIGDYRACSVLKLPVLVDRANDRGYHLLWLDAPERLTGRLTALSEPYPHKLNLELKPFQVQGFNWLKDRKAEILDWSTGTGKSVYACAKAKYLLEEGLVDHVVIVAKKHNRINWQRQLLDVADLESTIVGMYNIEGVWKDKRLSKKKNERLDPNVKYRREQYGKKVWVTNYEKFRDDKENIVKALQGKRVYFVWDEMPVKLKNSATRLYRSTRTVINKTKGSYHSCLSATPIENIPEDVYWCVRLMDKDALDKYVTEFRLKYVKEWDWFAKGKVKTWDTTKLPELGLRLAHMTHQANKYRDPEIRAQFPEEHWETILIEMSAQDRKLYTAIEKEIASEFWRGGLTDDIFTRLTPLRLVCNNPAYLGHGTVAESIRKAGIELTDKYSAKVEELKTLIPTLEGKVVLFSAFSENGSHWIYEYLQNWGISSVLYDGNSTQMQKALDDFTGLENIKVFVSSDKGSDSINLQQAVNVVNYDLPWKHSTMTQRVNRINRITSKGIGVDHVFYYTLIMANTYEERMLQILERKKGYGEAIFGGEIADQAAEIGKLSKEDLWWIITGER